MWHIILDTKNNEYVVLYTKDGIISQRLIDVDENVWAKNLQSFTEVIPYKFPISFDKWVSRYEYIKPIFFFESNDPINFIQSVHITHPELFI